MTTVKYTYSDIFKKFMGVAKNYKMNNKEQSLFMLSDVRERIEKLEKELTKLRPIHDNDKVVNTIGMVVDIKPLAIPSLDGIMHTNLNKEIIYEVTLDDGVNTVKVYMKDPVEKFNEEEVSEETSNSNNELFLFSDVTTNENENTTSVKTGNDIKMYDFILIDVSLDSVKKGIEKWEVISPNELNARGMALNRPQNIFTTEEYIEIVENLRLNWGDKVLDTEYLVANSTVILDKMTDDDITKEVETETVEEEIKNVSVVK